jgi:hypothetical protein
MIGRKAAKGRHDSHRMPTNSVFELPKDFQQNRSRAASEIPGNPDASRMSALLTEMERQHEGRQIGQMMIDHMKTMNKITLGMKS